MKSDNIQEPYIFKDTTQVNRFYDWGIYNDITEGYLIATLQALNYDNKAIAEATITLENLFNTINAETARTAKEKFWQIDII